MEADGECVADPDLALCGAGTTLTDGMCLPTPPPVSTFKEFDADEGGEVRMEYARRTGDSSTFTRVTAFLFKDPGTTKFHPFVNIDGDPACTDVRDDTKWPIAVNPIAERVYLDPGSVVISGGPNALNVPRNTAAGTPDPFSRVHPANEWFFKPPVSAATDSQDGNKFQTEKTSYDVVFGGSDELGPAQIFDDVLYSPADFQLISPAQSATPVALTAATDLTLTWQTPDNEAPAGYMVSSLVGFVGPNGPIVVCVEPNDGSVTVPAAMIDIVRAEFGTAGTTGSTLARQTLTHVVRELNDKDGPTGRRIDFVSVWCYAGQYSVAPSI